MYVYIHIYITRRACETLRMSISTLRQDSAIVCKLSGVYLDVAMCIHIYIYIYIYIHTQIYRCRCVHIYIYI